MNTYNNKFKFFTLNIKRLSNTEARGIRSGRAQVNKHFTKPLNLQNIAK